MTHRILSKTFSHLLDRNDEYLLRSLLMSLPDDEFQSAVKILVQCTNYDYDIFFYTDAYDLSKQQLYTVLSCYLIMGYKSMIMDIWNDGCIECPCIVAAFILNHPQQLDAYELHAWQLPPCTLKEEQIKSLNELQELKSKTCQLVKSTLDLSLHPICVYWDVNTCKIIDEYICFEY